MDDLTTLREAWQPPAPPSRDAARQARTALLSRAADPAAATGARRRRPRLPRLGVRLVAVGALAVTIAAGVTVLQSLGGADQNGRPKSALPGVPGGPVANAQEALERAARTVESKPWVAPRPNLWIYMETRTTKSVEGRPAGSTQPLSRVIREWRRVDGTQTAYIEDGRLRIQKLPRLPDKHPGRLSKAVQGWEAYMRKPTALPPDPDAILRLAYGATRGATNGPGSTQDQIVYTLFTKLLGENVLPPKVEAAVFRAVAKIKGVTLYPKVTDVLGRPALNLGMSTGGALDMRQDLLLDRATYAYMGQRNLVLKDELSGKIYPDRKVLVKKHTEFVFARIITKIVDHAGDRV